MTLNPSCLGCRYRRPLGAANPTETACHYLLDTGKQRGCPAECCTRWEPSESAYRLLATAQREG